MMRLIAAAWARGRRVLVSILCRSRLRRQAQRVLATADQYLHWADQDTACASVRQAAKDLLAQARAQKNEADALVASRKTSWLTVQAKAQSCIDLARQASNLAAEDQTLSKKAASSLHDAQRVVRQVRAEHGDDAIADCDKLLQEALSANGRQEYESAQQHADQAFNLTRDKQAGFLWEKVCREHAFWQQGAAARGSVLPMPNLGELQPAQLVDASAGRGWDSQELMRIFDWLLARLKYPVHRGQVVGWPDFRTMKRVVALQLDFAGRTFGTDSLEYARALLHSSEAQRESGIWLSVPSLHAAKGERQRKAQFEKERYREARAQAIEALRICDRLCGEKDARSMRALVALSMVPPTSGEEPDAQVQALLERLTEFLRERDTNS